MSEHQRAREDRLRELLAGASLGDLCPEEIAELEELLEHGTAPRSALETDDYSVGALLVAADRAFVDEGERDAPAHLPAHLADRLVGLGHGFADVSGRGGQSEAGASTSPEDRGGSTTAVRPVVATLGWIAAAAAASVALVLWVNRPSGVGPVLEPSPAQLAAELADRADALVLPIQGAGLLDGEGNKGDLVWDPRTQQGYLRLTGVTPNEPDERQFQLWIFDAARGEFAVDGGVFDIDTAAGTVVIPFRPKLRVTDPAAFAVTMEQPGGVVVTDQSGLVLLAPVASG